MFEFNSRPTFVELTMKLVLTYEFRYLNQNFVEYRIRKRIDFRSLTHASKFSLPDCRKYFEIKEKNLLIRFQNLLQKI